jgi:hypothetical protein
MYMLVSHNSKKTPQVRFRREVEEICDLLQNYAAYSGNFLPTFRGNQAVPSSNVKNPKKKLSRSFFMELLTLEYWASWLIRNVGKKFSLYAA